MYDFLYFNLVQKFAGSLCYSTLGKGECGTSRGGGTCDWRVVKRSKRVAKPCQEEHLIKVVEAAGTGCLKGAAGCSRWPRTGTAGPPAFTTR